MLKRNGFFLVVLAFVVSCGASVIPEMKEFMDAFGDKTKMGAVIEKYAEPEVMPKEISLCDLEKPIIKKTEQKNGRIYYSLESTVKECARSEAAKGTTRMFTLGWEKGRLVEFIWQGPKSGKVEY